MLFMKEESLNPKNNAANFKIKYYPLGDWHPRRSMSKQEWVDGDSFEQTVLHDVPLGEIFTKEEITKLCLLKEKRKQKQ